MIQSIKIDEIFILAENHHKKNNFKEAQKLYESIIKIEPNHLKTIFRLGSLFAQTNNFDKAINFLNKVIVIEPNHSKAHNNLGIVFNSLRQYQKAEYYLKKAIEINPKHEEAYNNLGLVFFELGKFENAIKCYHEAIEINSNNHNAIKNISILFRQFGVDSFLGTDLERLRKLFLLLYKRNDIEHKDIFLNTKKILLAEKNYTELKQIVSFHKLLEKPTINNLINDELFHLMLQKSLIADNLFETILTKIRREILSLLIKSDLKTLEKKFEFIVSLAEQCFLNEYCFFQSNEETNWKNELKISVEKNTEVNELELAILGCYTPLISSKYILNKLLKYKSKNNLFNNLINMHIKEPLKENSFIGSIKSLDVISDPVSKIVREQYEENPFPRWRYTYRKTSYNPLVIINNQINPNKIQLNDKFNRPKVLIAGCGTGKQIFIAQNYLNAKIIATDLSKKSLAYAKRKAEESKIDNVEFLHADILKLNNLDKKFDIIECVGVLHHMKDPLKGLKVLLNLLEPQGFMKLGLYSDIARQDIEQARQLIIKKNYKSEFGDIIKFRQEIIKEKKNESLKKISHRFDFYSTSGVRDLLFNAQEHRFSLLQISEIMTNFNLEFLGFSDKNVKEKYSKLYSNDKKNILLDNWHKFEIDNTDTFSSMYNFWIRKKI